MPFQPAKFGEKSHMIKMPPNENIGEKPEQQQQSKCNQTQDYNYFEVGLDMANLTLYSQKKNDTLMDKTHESKYFLNIFFFRLKTSIFNSS